jgi:hypothetical protein
MSDLKPLGSEKLQGMDKIKRILELSKYQEKKPVSLNESKTTEYKLNMSDGYEYQIVKEKNGYIIVKTISEGVTSYIEPLENRKYHKSYSSALRRLNLMAKEFNVIHENEEGTSLFGEQKKYVLKTPKSDATPAAEPAPAPMPEPSAEAPAPMPVPAPMPEPDMGDMSPDMSGEEGQPSEPEMEPDMDTEMEPEMGGEGEEDGEEEASLKGVQKLVGKLSQKLRTLSKKDEEIDSKDIKYVINSIISALDLDKLEDEDKEEIIGRLESDETEEEPEMEPDMDTEMEPEVETPEPPTEEGGEIGEEDHGYLGEKFKDAVSRGYGSKLTKAHPFELDEYDAVNSITEKLFSESDIDKVLSKYFKTEKSQNTKIVSEIERLSESIDQELASKRIMKKLPNAKLLGKTNKQNLVFEHKNRQYKVTRSGKIL